jgi:hypothetical protein
MRSSTKRIILGNSRLWDLDILPSSSLAAWWSLHPDAARVSSFSLATGVSGINDVSGNGVNLVQATTGFQPTLNNSGINGYRSVDSDGTKFMSFLCSALNGQQDITFMAVTTPATDGNRRYAAGLGSNQSINTSGIRWGVFSQGSLSSDGLGWGGTNADVWLGNGSPVIPNTPVIHVYEKNSTGWRITQNGVLISTASDTSFPSSAFSGILFAELFVAPSTIGYPAVCRFGEIAIIAGGITTNTQQLIEGIWAWRWKIPLISTHPYYVQPPRR